MAWLLSCFAALLIVWLCDLFGVNRQNVLYLNTQICWILLPVTVMGVGLIAFLSYVRRSATAEKGGRWYVLRRTDPLRWGALGLLLSALAGSSAGFFSANVIEMSVTYFVHESFVTDARITDIRSSAPHAAGGCKRYATLVLQEAEKADVCVVRLYGISLLDPSLDGDLDSVVTLRGRRGWAGAVVDRIDLR